MSIWRPQVHRDSTGTWRIDQPVAFDADDLRDMERRVKREFDLPLSWWTLPRYLPGADVIPSEPVPRASVDDIVSLPPYEREVIGAQCNRGEDLLEVRFTFVTSAATSFTGFANSLAGGVLTDKFGDMAHGLASTLRRRASRVAAARLVVVFPWLVYAGLAIYAWTQFGAELWPVLTMLTLLPTAGLPLLVRLYRQVPNWKVVQRRAGAVMSAMTRDERRANSLKIRQGILFAVFGGLVGTTITLLTR